MSKEPDFANAIHQGDAAEQLRQMPADSVHMAMTSPPYFQLRDYGADGQIGLEDSLEEYIANLVDVGRELRRVLRDDGSWWLNLGDSYATSRSDHMGGIYDDDDEYADGEGYVQSPENALGRKNKMLVPHRVATALQDDGWIVRNDVTWVKPNPMPSSVKDRLNTTTEQIFHLVPEPDYWYDLDAIREPHAQATKEAAEKGWSKSGQKRAGGESPGNHHDGGLHDDDRSRKDQLHPNGKNPGDVFEVTTKPFPDAHFAVYPPELCETPIKATAPPTVCAECGKGYERDVEYTPIRERFKDKVATSEKHEELKESGAINDAPSMSNSHDVPQVPKIEHKGWLKPCDCQTDETHPGIVLDPFTGAGTTLLKAKELGRWFVGTELNEEYVAMAQKRVGINIDDPSKVLDDGQESLLDNIDSDD